MTVELGPTRVLRTDHELAEAGLVNYDGLALGIVGYPLSAGVSSPFGPRVPIQTPAGWTSDHHSGIDLPAPKGTPILAPAPGSVRWSGKDTAGAQILAMRFEDESGALFVHMEGPQLGVGNLLRRGDFVGFVGTSGLSTGDHLHFMRTRWVGEGPTWYPLDALIDPLSDEGGFTEELSLPPADPPRDVVTGTWPTPGGQALIATIAECTPEEIVAEAVSEGCSLASIWILEAGVYRPYIVGAPAAANAAFGASVAPGRALFVRSN